MRKLIIMVVCLTMVAFVSGAMAQPKAEPKKTDEKAAAASAPAPAVKAPDPVAPAPEKAKEMKMEKFTGTVEKMDDAAKAVVVKYKKGAKTFMIDDKTRITKGKDNLTPADLKKGMNVSVSYKKDGDKMVAADVKVAVPKAAKKAEKKEKPAEKAAPAPAPAAPAPATEPAPAPKK